MKMIHFLLFKSNLILIWSIVFFLVSLVRRQRIASTNVQQMQHYGQLLDIRMSTESKSPPSSNHLPSCRVYTGLYSHFLGKNGIDSLSKRLKQILSTTSSNLVCEFLPMDIQAQLKFIEQYGNTCNKLLDRNEITGENNEVLSMYRKLISKEHTTNLAQELWKYCALSFDVEAESNNADMIAYIDIDSPLLDNFGSILDGHDSNGMVNNFAVLGDSLSQSSHSNANTIHGSLLILRKNNQYEGIAQQMIKAILSDADAVMYDPLFIAQKLYGLITRSRDEYNDGWVFLKQRCHSNPFQTNVLQQKRQVLMAETTQLSSLQTVINCPEKQIYCCDITKPNGKVVMMTRHILLPYQLIPQMENTLIPEPIQYEIPFITTVKAEVTNAQSKQSTSFFQLVLQKDCLPTSRECELCMTRSEFNAGTCKVCAKFCGCFCNLLCHAVVEEKPVSKIFTGVLPKYRRDPTRLIPRIIHQTWFEPITREN